jgi:glycosyltransferase involved in cell wall biosynthesis
MNLPLVTCIMPTANRRAFVPHAIEYFLRQDYAERELVILDDGEDAIGDLVPADARITYLRETRRRSVGAKRNACIDAARGEIVVHWDDDDWSAPQRISRAVDALVRENADLCGVSAMLFFDPLKRLVWEYRYPGAQPDWVCGTSLCYRRALWRRNRFADVQIGEDSRFIWSARGARTLCLPDTRLIAALVHDANTSPRRTGSACWQSRPWESVEALLGADVARYTNSPVASVSASRDSAAAEQSCGGHGSADGVLVGIHVYELPERLNETLCYLRTNAPPATRIVLLADGPDAATRRALASMPQMPVVLREHAAGAATCFNDLLRYADAPAYVFLECGARVGAGCIERLVAALSGDAACALAGPSTNRHWNVQAVFPEGRGDPADVARNAASAATEYGDAVRPLAPLYGIGDFCLAISKAAVAAIGGANEAYGAGPCWEIDLAVRVARSGLAVGWVAGAYVHRSPFSPRRAREEPAALPASKRLFQDLFCGRILRGERDGYVDHCRGDACPHFAPHDEIVLRYPVHGAPESRTRPARAAAADVPLVSCIMPTRDRTAWALQAIEYFMRQDYPNRELCIVDDGAPGLERELPCDPRIRYLRMQRRESIGAKRNRACELATGAFIVHWDDDDWHGRERVSRQIDPLRARSADITALRHAPFYEVERGACWRCSDEVHWRLFVHDVRGGTLAYRRDLFTRGLRFPDQSLAEDAHFLRRAVMSRARLAAIDAHGLYVYVRHGENSWSLQRNEADTSWSACAPPVEMLDDLAFYETRRSPAQPSAGETALRSNAAA